MYAVIESGGKQYRVAQGEQVVVDRLDAEVGSEVELPVLLVGGDAIKIGSPTVDGAKVSAKVVDHFRGEKVITFKMKRRKRSRRRQGFRAGLTTLEITAISA